MGTSAIKKDYFSFDGRINRQPFWMRTLMLWVVMFVLAMIGALLVTIAGDSSAVAGIVGLVALVVYIPLLIAALSLNIRRCHDRGRAGWFVSGCSLQFCYAGANIVTTVNIAKEGTPCPD